MHCIGDIMNGKIQFNGKPMSLRRVFVYILGLFCMALGIAFAITSDFGVSPVTTVPYVAGRVLGVSVGLGTIVSFIVFILFQLCIYRSHFKLSYILQFPVAIMFGYFTDFTKMLVAPLGTPSGWPMQLAYYVVCIILVGLGLRAYLTADIMELPSDGVSLCIAWATKKPLHIIKRFFDCFCVILSSAVSILVLHDWEGIWIGTILAALFTGTSLKIWTGILQRPLEKFLFADTDKEGLCK